MTESIPEDVKMRIVNGYNRERSGDRWGDAHNYDLAINAALGRETCVKMILDAVAAKEKTMETAEA